MNKAMASDRVNPLGNAKRASHRAVAATGGASNEATNG
jgi:hypothetical protein